MFSLANFPKQLFPGLFSVHQTELCSPAHRPVQYTTEFTSLH